MSSARYRALLSLFIAITFMMLSWCITETQGSRGVWESIRSAEQARLPAVTNADGSRAFTPVGFESTSPCPFIIKAELRLAAVSEKRCYLWFFGYIRHLAQFDSTSDVNGFKSIVVPKGSNFEWETYWQTSSGARIRNRSSWIRGTTGVSLLVTVVFAAWPVLSRYTRPRSFRFSIRTLVIILAVFSVYCACWRMTNMWGVRSELGNGDALVDWAKRGIRGYAVAPFVLCVESPAEIRVLPDGTQRGDGIIRRFVIWNPFGSNIALYP